MLLFERNIKGIEETSDKRFRKSEKDRKICLARVFALG